MAAAAAGDEGGLCPWRKPGSVLYVPMWPKVPRPRCCVRSIDSVSPPLARAAAAAIQAADITRRAETEYRGLIARDFHVIVDDAELRTLDSDNAAYKE